MSLILLVVVLTLFLLYSFLQHDNIKENLDALTLEMNSAIETFITEMKAQNAWNDVTIVMVSEFARTLPGKNYYVLS